jgi:ParB family chromosome partitioning protein
MTASAVAAQTVLTLRPEQVAQHPENLRDATRDIDALAASIVEVGVLVPLIVVPVDAIAGKWADTVTHVAVDGNRRQLAAAQVGADLPCVVRDDLAAARDTAVTMTVTALARDGWTISEEINGVQMLLDFGLSQAAISRASGRKAAEVRAAKKAATLTPDTAESARAYDLTLDQLAILADRLVMCTELVIERCCCWCGAV